jgi:hypothetical protein
MSSPYWSAFDALRRNKPLAEEFVSQLQGLLLEFLDRELVPALAQSAAVGASSASLAVRGRAQVPVQGREVARGPSLPLPGSRCGCVAAGL